MVYLGTATYDAEGPRDAQTQPLRDAGASVRELAVAGDVGGGQQLQRAEAAAMLGRADAIVVSGGNTLYAVDRWRLLGVDEMLAEAARRGAGGAGGSAGAICWFDSGHSDSGDPASFKRAASLEALDFGGSDDNTAAPPEAWEYCRVPGLGLLPGLLCPHHDRTQSNGVLRAEDFASMVANNPASPGGGGGDGDGDGGGGERGIGLTTSRRWCSRATAPTRRWPSARGDPSALRRRGRAADSVPDRAQGRPGLGSSRRLPWRWRWR